MDYDKDPFLVLRFWFWVCECVDSPGKEIIVLRWKMKPLCVCVCLTLVTCSTSSTFDMKVFSDFTSLTVPFSHNMQEFSASVADFPFSVVKLSRRYQLWLTELGCSRPMPLLFFYLTFVNRPLKRRTIKHKNFNRVLNRLHLFVATRKILTPPPPIPPSSLIMPVPLHLPVLVECTHAWWSEIDSHSEGIGNRAVSMCMHACGK